MTGQHQPDAASSCSRVSGQPGLAQPLDGRLLTNSAITFPSAAVIVTRAHRPAPAETHGSTGTAASEQLTAFTSPSRNSDAEPAAEALASTSQNRHAGPQLAETAQQRLGHEAVWVAKDDQRVANGVGLVTPMSSKPSAVCFVSK